MSEIFLQLFNDESLVQNIKQKLPILFYMAELESSRAGKIGMQVGSLRENIIIALLIHKFGEENVTTEIPITEAEVDVRLFNLPISIKTKSGKGLAGVKLIWTVDPIKAIEFKENYEFMCDIIFVHVNWGDVGGFYYITLDNQKHVFEELGRDFYIKLPKEGTNPRGVEFTKEAMVMMLKSENIKKIEILWEKPKVKLNPYKRWIDYWRE